MRQFVKITAKSDALGEGEADLNPLTLVFLSSLGFAEKEC